MLQPKVPDAVTLSKRFLRCSHVLFPTGQVGHTGREWRSCI